MDRRGLVKVAGIEAGMTLSAVKGLIVDATTVDRFLHRYKGEGTSP
jgi:hypothetical protein